MSELLEALCFVHVYAGCRVHCKQQCCVSRHLKWWHHIYKCCYTQQEHEKHTLETLRERGVGHKGCCHYDSRKPEPMAIPLSSSAFWLALWSFTQLITEWILPSLLITHKSTHSHLDVPLYMHSAHRHTGKHSVCFSVSLVWSSIIYGSGWMKGCFGSRHASHMERERGREREREEGERERERYMSTHS